MTYKILLVDDDELLVETYTAIFELEGFNVLTAKSPYEAIHIVKDKEIDIAILDYNLPYMTGAELGHILYKSQNNVKIMFISGNEKIEELVNNVNYHVYAVLSKPFPIDVLLVKVKEIFHQSFVTDGKSSIPLKFVEKDLVKSTHIQI